MHFSKLEFIKCEQINIGGNVLFSNKTKEVIILYLSSSSEDRIHILVSCIVELKSLWNTKPIFK